MKLSEKVRSTSDAHKEAVKRYMCNPGNATYDEQIIVTRQLFNDSMKELDELEAKAEKAELYKKALELCAKEIQPVVVFGHKPIYGYNTAEHWLEKAREGIRGNE